jgi:hypothetical protein
MLVTNVPMKNQPKIRPVLRISRLSGDPWRQACPTSSRRVIAPLVGFPDPAAPRGGINTSALSA